MATVITRKAAPSPFMQDIVISASPFSLVTYLCSVEMVTLCETTITVVTVTTTPGRYRIKTTSVVVITSPLVIGLKKCLKVDTMPSPCVKQLLS